MKLNKKGFTLIEMLLVVVILGILSLLLVPTINTLTEKNDDNNLKLLKESIELSAKNYAIDNKFELFSTCENNNNEVTLQVLVDKKYLKEPVKNPKTKENISLTQKVTVSYDCETKEYIINADSIKF